MGRAPEANAGIKAAIDTARASGMVADYEAAHRAVAEMPKGRAKPVYTRALGALPLADPHTRMIALAVECTVDTSRTDPTVVGGNNGTVFVAMRRADPEESGAALDVAAAIDRKSGDVALVGATMTPYLPGMHLDPLPVHDGRLDVGAIRRWDEPLRRAYSMSAAMLDLTGTGPQ